ncbi:hypothetical protein PEDI_43330 [Persicobacter diffluens]|uniref:Uncharacterized protein n=1 Tax=Persicobacter diffluens TaxID=981 RepID=A0AAN4W316_9BACT|nr:hypothetical protein PEDI_43330 [Persicobacter diffluens]
MIYDSRSKILYDENGVELRNCKCEKCDFWEEFRNCGKGVCPKCKRQILTTKDYSESELMELAKKDFCFKYEMDQDNIVFIF